MYDLVSIDDVDSLITIAFALLKSGSSRANAGKLKPSAGQAPLPRKQCTVADSSVANTAPIAVCLLVATHASAQVEGHGASATPLVAWTPETSTTCTNFAALNFLQAYSTAMADALVVSVGSTIYPWRMRGESLFTTDIDNEVPSSHPQDVHSECVCDQPERKSSSSTTTDDHTQHSATLPAKPITTMNATISVKKRRFRIVAKDNAVQVAGSSFAVNRLQGLTEHAQSQQPIANPLDCVSHAEPGYGAANPAQLRLGLLECFLRLRLEVKLKLETCGCSVLAHSRKSMPHIRSRAHHSSQTTHQKPQLCDSCKENVLPVCLSWSSRL
jgi:hypothetical protein